LGKESRMSEAMPHPITLEQVFFTRSSVIAVPGHTPDEKIVFEAPVNNLNVSKVDGRPGHFSASMRTIVNQAMEKTSPYAIDMECFAVFSADSTLSEEEALRGVLITANSVLYGAIREAVSWITGRQPYGPFLFGLSVLKTSPPPKPVDS